MTGTGRSHLAPLLRVPPGWWPEQDRRAWHASRDAAVNPFARGPGAQAPRGRRALVPRPATIRGHERAFGVFVAFLMRHVGEIGPTVVPHVTPAVLDAYVADQQGRGNRPTTIAKRLDNLRAALRRIAPALDTKFLARPGGLPMGKVFSLRPRPVATRDQSEIIDQIQVLHAKARAGGFRYANGATGLRDAALMAILASRAPRIGELAAMDIGQHLVWQNGQWAMWVASQTNKNDRARHIPLPGWVQPIMADYIGLGRPRLGGHLTPALWLSTQRKRCPISTLSERVVHWTRRWFGAPHGPHWLRKCFTTTIANEHPELLPDTAVVLDHSPPVALAFYNRATTQIAGGRHNERIDARIAQGEEAGRAFLDRMRPPATRRSTAPPTLPTRIDPS
jgi:site-specific recombinase XerC